MSRPEGIDTDDFDIAVRRIESADAWDATDELVELDVKQPLDTVVPIRLRPAQWQDLRRQARERGMSPSAMMHAWLFEKLHGTPVS